MKNIKQKYYGQQIEIVNSTNICQTKFKHKIYKKNFVFNIVLSTVAILIFVNCVNVFKSVI